MRRIGDTVIDARGVSKRYRLSTGPFGKTNVLQAVSDVSLSIRQGETVVLVGESGSGKSTLGRMVAFLEQPTKGELNLDGAPVDTKDISPEQRRAVQLVFQNPYRSLNPRLTVGQILAEPLILQRRLNADERRENVRDMIAKIGLLDEHVGRYPHMFSGGQRQRIAIARALMLQPRVVVADEPVSALDVSVQAQILNLFLDIQDQTNVGYLFITHDMAVARHMADRILVMRHGRIVEEGAADHIFANPVHPYTKALLEAAPRAPQPLDRR